MLFDLDFELPETLEEEIPTASKLALKRGIAGNKRKRHLAARAAETKISCQKAKRLCPLGPMVSLFERVFEKKKLKYCNLPRATMGRRF